MIKNESGKSSEQVCNLSYLNEMMGNKKHLVKEIMDVFLEQVPVELKSLNIEEIEKEKLNYV